MRTLVLDRFAATEDGVIGRLGRWYTLEEEDRGNQPRISSIPANIYRCRRSFFNKGGYPTFEVTGVPGRTFIKFHAGNSEEDSEGCILLGSNFGAANVRAEETGDYRPKIVLRDSRVAFDQFMASLEGVDVFDLEIVEHY